jgi:hypothetical protein
MGGVGGFFKGDGDGGRLLAKGTENNGRSVLLVSEGHGLLSSTAKGTKCHKRKRLSRRSTKYTTAMSKHSISHNALE